MYFLLILCPPETSQIPGISEAGLSVRYVTVIDGIPFYRSTGQNSHSSKLWFPFNGFQELPPIFRKHDEMLRHCDNMGSDVGKILDSLPAAKTYAFWRFGNLITMIYSIALNELIDPSAISVHYQETFNILRANFPGIVRAIDYAKQNIEQSAAPLQQLLNMAFIPKSNIEVHDLKPMFNYRPEAKKQGEFDFQNAFQRRMDFYRSVISPLNNWLVAHGTLWGGDTNTTTSIPTFANLPEQVKRHPHWQEIFNLIFINTETRPFQQYSLALSSSSSSSDPSSVPQQLDSVNMLQTPDWARNTPNCQNCQRSFSFFVRRHHCRSCGRCICANCCKKKGFLVCRFCLATGTYEHLVHRPLKNLDVRSP